MLNLKSQMFYIGNLTLKLIFIYSGNKTVTWGPNQNAFNFFIDISNPQSHIPANGFMSK